MKQYFKVLGLPANANLEEVKNARNNLLKKYHPDCYKGSISFAEEKTREINEAFAILSEYLKKQEKEEQLEKLKKQEKKEKHESQKSANKNFEKQKNENYTRVNVKKEKVYKTSQSHEKPKKEGLIKEDDTETEYLFNDSEYISEIKPKKKKYISGTIIEDERKTEKDGKRILDIMIYGSFLLLIVLVILFMTGVI